MKARDLRDYLFSLNGGWVDPDQTVDTFKAGDPEVEIRGIAVGWMGYIWALQQALELGCNVFVTHEPTFYDHYDQDPQIFELPGVAEKQRFIQENGLVILRCHDLWDQVPGIGIPDSWGDWLGLGPKTGGEGYFRFYDVSGRTALDVARQVAERVKAFGQAAVELIGPGDSLVTRASVGTGAIISNLTMSSRYGADLVIATDDGIRQWQDGAYAIDMNIPIIVVNHAVSEEAGLANLARHLQSRFPDIAVHHIPQRCMFQLVGL
jgi:hypothetical protein